MVMIAVGVFAGVWLAGWTWISFRDWRDCRREHERLAGQVMARRCERVVMTRAQRCAENQWSGARGLR